MTRPVPIPTPETQRYWDMAAKQQLWLPHCNDCDTYIFYPRFPCPSCGSDNVDWVQLSGRGTLASYIINHRPAPGYADAGPYVIALVELAEGPRLMTNLVDVEADPGNLKVGMALEVTFEQRDEMWLPQFRPAGEVGVR